MTITPRTGGSDEERGPVGLVLDGEPHRSPAPYRLLARTIETTLVEPILYAPDGDGFADELLVDAAVPVAAALVAGGTRLAVRLQSGYVYGYAFVMLLGLVGLASWAMVNFL